MFEIDTEQWERKQQVKLQKAGEEGTRLYRLLEARRGNVTKEFWIKSRALMEDPEMWSALPPGSFTLECRAMAFATVAPSQGSIWYYLDYVWQHLYPFPLFDLADETLDAVEVTRRVMGRVDEVRDGGESQQLDLLRAWANSPRPKWWGWWSWPWWWYQYNGFGECRWTVKLAPGERVRLEADWHYYWR